MAENSDLTTTIEGCREGRPEAFEVLVDHFSERLYGYFYRLVGNRDICDELLSTLFLKLVRSIKDFAGGNFEAWLFRMASNTFYDYLREKQRHRKMMQYQQQQYDCEPKAAGVHENEMADELQKQLEQLDEGTREVIMLRYYSDLSFKQIAEMRAEPIGTTLSKLHRGLKKLRELME